MFAIATVVGHVGKDAEQKYDSSGKSRVQFSVAANAYTKTKEGFKDETDWYNVVTFGNYGSDIKKGDLVVVSGPLRVKTYTGKDGTTRVDASIVANSLRRITKKAHDQHDVKSDRPSKEVPNEDIPF